MHLNVGATRHKTEEEEEGGQCGLCPNQKLILAY